MCFRRSTALKRSKTLMKTENLNMHRLKMVTKMVTKKLTDVIALMHTEFQVPVVLSFTAVLVRTSEDAAKALV